MPSEGPPSKTETSGRTPGAGSPGGAVKSLETEAQAAAVVTSVTAVASASWRLMGPAEGWSSKVADSRVTPEGKEKNPGTGSDKVAGSQGPLSEPAEGLQGTSAGSRGSSEGTRPSGCYRCGKRGHCGVNCPEKAKTGSKSKKDTKRERSGVSGQTPEDKQAKTKAPVSAEATKYRKPAFDWSQVILVVLMKDGQPMSLEEYEDEKGNFVLKEIDLAEKDGSMIDIDDWSWFQDRVEVKFYNVVFTETFRKLMVGCNIISKAKWEEEHMKLHHFTGKIDKATMKARLKGLGFMVKTRRQTMGIPGYFRLEKVVCQTTTGAIVLISSDDAVKQKWEETLWKGNPIIRIPGSGMVPFQERSKGKKTLQEVSKSLQVLDMASDSDLPPAAGGLAGGKNT